MQSLVHLIVAFNEREVPLVRNYKIVYGPHYAWMITAIIGYLGLFPIFFLLLPNYAVGNNDR